MLTPAAPARAAVFSPGWPIASPQLTEITKLLQIIHQKSAAPMLA
jgi:hypothetical protein